MNVQLFDTFVEKTIFDPLNSLCFFVKDQLDYICVGLFLGSHSVLLIYLSFLLLTPSVLIIVAFMVSFEVGLYLLYHVL